VSATEQVSDTSNIEDDGYTSEPTHIRLTGDCGEWTIDGVDNDLRYTEPVWTFDTFDEAVAAIPEFVKDTAERVTWKWDTNRPHMARHTTQHRINTHHCKEQA
jgi:hypothetical protein